MVLMLAAMCPRTHHRYTALPILGSRVDDFVQWLAQCDYRLASIRVMLCPLVQVEQWLQSHGIQDLTELDTAVLEACWRHGSRRSTVLGALIHALARYLETTGVLRPLPPPPPTPSQRLLSTYTEQLAHLRGLAAHTIQMHRQSVAELLDALEYDRHPACLEGLQASQIEAFVRRRAAGLGRGSQQHLVAHLRSFLRFVAAHGQCPAGLDTPLDTPRLYRLEQLPRALPWETVQALLASIDQRTTVGVRDYTMLLLIATYGLRVSEVTALTLDDLHWRDRWMRVPRCKTRSPLHLPLTDRVGTALVAYLQHARPAHVACRTLFLRYNAPLRALGRTAVSMVFARWAKRSGLPIPFSGAHCLRHAYAVHLLRTGHALKTIGDLLGHRDSDSTYVYLRLATEELREVALPVPTLPPAPLQEEPAP
jgi:site-specific recombinase XerD